jgi:hypothetical protein
MAHVHMHFTNRVADQLINLFHLFGQRVAIIGISREAFCANEPPMSNWIGAFVATVQDRRCRQVLSLEKRLQQAKIASVISE